MSEILKIENLSKVYKRQNQRCGKKITEDFLALRDLSLSINQGEVLGVIGKNGSGKSTLLKILSKITSPTSGKVTVRGRVSSLLEVGTGFHPEMTGRENIYMNGNILGMSNAEINRKLDDIVDFSGVGEFLETPVKRYSSGMQTRLAFAVAAHLEPEILIIDEVLAVGDAEFQKKCLGKMEEIGNSGRTILFVSHNMNAIKNLCNRCIWLKDGQKVSESKQTADVVKQYLTETLPANKDTSWHNSFEKVHNKYVDFLEFKLVDKNNVKADFQLNGVDEIFVNIEFQCKEAIPELQIGYALYNSARSEIFHSYQNDRHDSQTMLLSKDRYSLTSRLPLEILNDGDYTIQLIAGVRNTQAILSRADSEVTIGFCLSDNLDRSNLWRNRPQSLIAPVLEWEHNKYYDEISF